MGTKLIPGGVHMCLFWNPVPKLVLESNNAFGICDNGNPFVSRSVLMLGSSISRFCRSSEILARVSWMDDTILGVVSFCLADVEAAS